MTTWCTTSYVTCTYNAQLENQINFELFAFVELRRWRGEPRVLGVLLWRLPGLLVQRGGRSCCRKEGQTGRARGRRCVVVSFFSTRLKKRGVSPNTRNASKNTQLEQQRAGCWGGAGTWLCGVGNGQGWCGPVAVFEWLSRVFTHVFCTTTFCGVISCSFPVRQCDPTLCAGALLVGRGGGHVYESSMAATTTAAAAAALAAPAASPKPQHLDQELVHQALLRHEQQCIRPVLRRVAEKSVQVFRA